MSDFVLTQTDNIEPERISENIFLNMVRLAQSFRKSLYSSSESFDLSPNERGLMMIMYLDPSIDTANQIVKVLGTTKGLASRNIDNLKQKGLIKTNQDEKDRRIVRLTLCSRAKRICEEIRSDNMAVIKKAIEGVDIKDAMAALDVVQKMVANIR